MRKPNPALEGLRRAIDEIESTPGGSREVPIVLTLLEWHLLATFLDSTAQPLPPLAQAALIETRRRLFEQVNAAQDAAERTVKELTATAHLN